MLVYFLGKGNCDKEYRIIISARKSSQLVRLHRRVLLALKKTFFFYKLVPGTCVFSSKLHSLSIVGFLTSDAYLHFGLHCFSIHTPTFLLYYFYAFLIAPAESIHHHDCLESWIMSVFWGSNYWCLFSFLVLRFQSCIDLEWSAPNPTFNIIIRIFSVWFRSFDINQWYFSVCVCVHVCVRVCVSGTSDVWECTSNVMVKIPVALINFLTVYTILLYMSLYHIFWKVKAVFQFLAIKNKAIMNILL